MKSTFKINAGIHGIEITPHLFNGGELNVQLPEQIGYYDRVEIIANIADAEGIMTLALINDAIKRLVPTQRIGTTEVVLYLGYVPYARQDRVCNAGEALAIKIFCDMINAMEFGEVVILDPHSDVTPALLDRCIVKTQIDIIANSILVKDLCAGHRTLVAPDAGATKKVDALAEYFGGLDVVQGFKKRNTATGKLTGFGYLGNVEGQDLLIVDDICDGGGTFLGLAAKLREGGAATVSLYVSHGIFSNGIEVLLDGGIDKLYSTNSFEHGFTDKNLEITNWI